MKKIDLQNNLQDHEKIERIEENDRRRGFL